ncbi:hypothetical protein [Pseudomarimonas salicorniae]|uniref:Uncharacterized protein n=1 Tax=Pseudomarimonas salicorniae TaxID=2933270 RepID=A0ABT0GC57_9GAMM|nr:hypothetical protein [Lysobacter sp. CAU 1642]MCK7592119.1 hypothetical protein [Lysobacter sp. CAU 1642]
MSIERLNADHPQVRHRLERFAGQLAPMLTALRASERSELQRELQSHVLEAAARLSGSVDERLDEAIGSLGPAEDFLPELVEEIMLQRQAAGGSPRSLIRLASARGGRGLLGSILLMGCGLAMLFALALAACGLAALFLPGAGLYLNSWNDFTLSFVAQDHAPKVDDRIFVPGALLCAAGLYFGAARIAVWLLRGLLPR